jgi:hypothetical protein
VAAWNLLNRAIHLAIDFLRIALPADLGKWKWRRASFKPEQMQVKIRQIFLVHAAPRAISLTHADIHSEYGASYLKSRPESWTPI